MVNQLHLWVNSYPKLSQPLGSSQTNAFNKIKSELTSSPVLAWYNPAAEAKVIQL